MNNADLLGLLIFAVLHHIVDVAEHSLYRVWIGEVERKELDQGMVFDLLSGVTAQTGTRVLDGTRKGV